MTPISQALGHLIKCPVCGETAKVSPAETRVRPAGMAPEVVLMYQWYRVDCPKTGAKLYKGHEPVEVIG